MSSRPGFTFDASSSPLYRVRTSSEVCAVSDEVVAAALQRDATARRILAKRCIVQPAERVGSRLNLNVKRSTGVAVNTVHRGRGGDGYKANRGWWDGEVVAYAAVVCLRNAYFNVHQAARERIASGATAKLPMASVDGEYVLAAAPIFYGIELRFSPHREHLFRDHNGCAVRCAQDVTIVGNSVFARGLIEYYGEEDAPVRAGNAPSAAVFYQPSASPRCSEQRSGLEGMEDLFA